MRELIQHDAQGFGKFWAKYPLKVSRFRARAAYIKARTMASETDILIGLERYIKTKPAWQNWAYAASWLNAGRWEDEALTTAIQPPSRNAATFGGERTFGTIAEWLRECKHEPKCISSMKHAEKLITEQSHRTR